MKNDCTNSISTCRLSTPKQVKKVNHHGFNFTFFSPAEKRKFHASLLFLFFVNVLLLNAQDRLTVSEVLASAKNQYVLELQQDRIDFLKNTNSKLPLMDELEFRTETSDFQVREQEYTLRGRFHTRNQQRAQREFQQANVEVQSIEQQILLHELLQERYVGIVEVLYFEKLLEAKKRQILVLEDRLTVLGKSMNLPKFEITDFIEAEDELQAAERDILRLENATNFAQQKILMWTNNQGFLATESLELLDIEQVMEVVRTLPQEPSSSHAALVKRNINVLLAQSEQAVRRAEEENTFEFFQAKIGGTDDRGFQQNFSLGLGVRIPVRNTQQADLEELEFEKLDETNKYAALQTELTRRMANLRRSLENQYRLYELLTRQVEESQADFALQQYQKIAGVSPLALLKLKGSQFKKELELFKIQQDIYRLYVELLDASGKLAETPLRNYLTEGLESF